MWYQLFTAPICYNNDDAHIQVIVDNQLKNYFNAFLNDIYNTL